MDEEKLNLIIEILKIININISNLDELNNLTLEREVFFDDNKYQLINNLIPNIKKFYSSSNKNSLQKNASINQKFPLLNIYRQILRQEGFIMEPKRIANGYHNNEKKYKRIFIIRKKL